MARYPIGYASIIAGLRGRSAGAIRGALFDTLPVLWCAAYEEMSGGKVNIVAVPQPPYHLLFDLERERVVVSFGCSVRNPPARDGGRMAGWLGKISDRFEGRADKGHIMSHKQGGGMDINLFAQRTDVNRGRSAQGRTYRALERYCASNPGTFCFSRLIYLDQDWVLDEIEYGVLYGPTQFRTERFSNAAA